MPPYQGVKLFAAQRVFDAANRVLGFAGDLVRLAFGGQLGVADGFANSLFHRAFYDFCRSGDAIFVHDYPLVVRCPDAELQKRRVRFVT